MKFKSKHLSTVFFISLSLGMSQSSSVEAYTEKEIRTEIAKEINSMGSFPTMHAEFIKSHLGKIENPDTVFEITPNPLLPSTYPSLKGAKESSIRLAFTTQELEKLIRSPQGHGLLGTLYLQIALTNAHITYGKWNLKTSFSKAETHIDAAINKGHTISYCDRAFLHYHRKEFRQAMGDFKLATGYFHSCGSDGQKMMRKNPNPYIRAAIGDHHALQAIMPKLQARYATFFELTDDQKDELRILSRQVAAEEEGEEEKKEQIEPASQLSQDTQAFLNFDLEKVNKNDQSSNAFQDAYHALLIEANNECEALLARPEEKTLYDQDPQDYFDEVLMRVFVEKHLRK